MIGLPPRSNVDSPQYYANGPEVPTALRALESLGESSKTLDDEIDEQLVGIARFVNAPAGRPPLTSGLPRLTVASDLHNNVIALPALEGAARGGPLLFAGDLTDRGSPVELALVLRIARAGSRLIFVSGNHDSDVLERKLAGVGAIVLTRDGRLRGNGTTDGHVVTVVGGLRIAGYDDPLKRRARDGYRDNGAEYTPEEQERFSAWLAPLRGQVDVVMVHAPALAQVALQALRDDPPARAAAARRGPHAQGGRSSGLGPVTVLNPGSVGGGGTGNLAEAGGDVGLARVTYDRPPGVRPARGGPRPDRSRRRQRAGAPLPPRAGGIDRSSRNLAPSRGVAGPMRSTILLTLLALLALTLPSSAAARSSIRVGLGDQSPAMFDSPYFQQLNIKRTRYFVPV